MDQKNVKEINLMDILIAIGGWLVKSVRFFLREIGKIFQLLFRHKTLMITSILVCVGISQYFARQSNRIYNVDAMAVLHGVKAQAVRQIGNQLTASSAKLKETALGGKLGLSDSVAKKIIFVKFYNVIDYMKDTVPDRVDFEENHSLSDTVNVRMKDHVYIRIQLLGTNHAKEIGDAVLNFVNHNSVIKTDFETFLNDYREQIKVIDVETKRIDSLAKTKYFEDEKTQIRMQNNQLLIGNQTKQLFYGDLLYLQNRRTLAETRLATATAPVVVPSGFIINPKAINNRITNGMQGLLVGFILGLVLGVILENFRKWIKFLNGK